MPRKRKRANDAERATLRKRCACRLSDLIISFIRFSPIIIDADDDAQSDALLIDDDCA